MDENSQIPIVGRGKNKRFWKKDEEEALIDFLLDMSVDRQWKGEGGFKNGYLNHLEVQMNNKFPNSGLKALPHIDSKVKWFKDKYVVISEMILSRITQAGGLWRTPFPYLEKLDHVFGVDRANGIASELPEDSINNLEEIVNLANDNSDDDGLPQPPAAKKIKKEKTPKSTEKKKSPQILDLTSNQMATEFTGFMKGMSSHLETIANAMSSTQNLEIEVVEQKKRLHSKIASLLGMTKAESIRVACLFTSNPSQMDVFFSSPDDDWNKEVVLT
ncbi:hypothetical protein POM88_027809 [Heracleum sosnowskyi]|uniref:Myb/SANT-like domain-containing protein n=1 Tax=Heracleum sosnowskyi TaxID=360622 RepID=A0AAD8I923_9APIA|nr:hypothetical protein POM88_027809 [Heracleum sosnowskyi]